MFEFLEGNKALDDFFEFQPELFEQPNRRACVRYIRSDIKATIHQNVLFNFDGEIPVDLIDIGSKGVMIATGKKIGINQKITLSLAFDGGKTYKIKAKPVYVLKTASGFRYGIKFDQYNNELGDTLFETQLTLIFK